MDIHSLPALALSLFDRFSFRLVRWFLRHVSLPLEFPLVLFLLHVRLSF